MNRLMYDHLVVHVINKATLSWTYKFIFQYIHKSRRLEIHFSDEQGFFLPYFMVVSKLRCVKVIFDVG